MQVLITEEKFEQIEKCVVDIHNEVIKAEQALLSLFDILEKLEAIEGGNVDVSKNYFEGRVTLSKCIGGTENVCTAN